MQPGTGTAMSAWKEHLRRGVEALGYTVHRWPANRFDGMRDALTVLRDAGYGPRVVIDCGANMGQWARIARSVFPAAALHLVEPQPACASRLRALAGRTPGVSFHPVAVTEPAIGHVRMIGGGAAGGGSGAFVALQGEAAPDEVSCPATTLDELFAERVAPADRALLKLDLEGHELSALSGAARLLSSVEVVLSEVHFYEVESNGRPLVTDVLEFLGKRGFELYDFACLNSRPRDKRLRTGDAVFVQRQSRLAGDRSWA
jgi:FkbM family methyltransferase